MAICSADGCPAVVPKGRCPRHEAEHKETRRRRGLSTHSPTNRVSGSRRWREHVRPAILERDRRICAYCGADANSVDHVVPPSTHDGATLDLRNLVAACHGCQSRKGARTPEDAGMEWPIGYGCYANGEMDPRA